MSFGRLWTLRSELVGRRDAGPAGHDSTHVVMVDVGPTDHHRPVVGMLVDRGALIELFTLGLRELALTVELPALGRTQLIGKKPGVFRLGEGFPPIAHKGGTRREEKAARCSQEECDGFHRTRAYRRFFGVVVQDDGGAVFIS